MISIKEINDKKIWEEFILSQLQNSFFQSWTWGEVEAKIKNVWRLGIYDKDILVGVCQVVKVTAKRGSFFHLRHGPILNPWKATYFDILVDYLKKLAKNEKVWFLRVSPLIEKSVKNQQFFQKSGFRSAPIPGQDAETAWILDITHPEEELLAGMRRTTRYLIRKAQKLGVKVVEGKVKQDFNVFFQLYQGTAKRQAFIPHQGIKEEWEILGRQGLTRLFLAKYQGKILAGALIVFYGNQAIYHHSGSLETDIPASYALLWKAIRQAKNEGKTIFNFWGIAPANKPRHPWQGLTLFKTGFGGEIQESIHAQDLPLSPLYWFTYLIETGRKIAWGY
ncbi:peptidoglycan bridge formation glycyltransferase FemA/FemB family protein [Candidatus Gottesmanbacteria bacterium]|nr:peptidoglycan bridge formation glycyltransferase FemA/FemB family protein [Candidatus Gottesmanbacteria bacterium]